MGDLESMLWDWREGVEGEKNKNKEGSEEAGGGRLEMADTYSRVFDGVHSRRPCALWLAGVEVYVEKQN